MKTVLAFLAAFLLATPAFAQRGYDQAELDALLAPVALQPDGVLSQILIASTRPAEVAAAASWSRAYPHLRGDEAVRAVQYEPWDQSVKALVAFPDLLARMDQSPQWLHDLGDAFLRYEPQVMDTVQGLRRRAQAAGHLASNQYATISTQGEAIVVQPPPQVVYVRYYDPYVVYGPWWWPHYRPVFWRPWAPAPVFVAPGFFYSSFNWHHRHVRVVHHHGHRHWNHWKPGPVIDPVRVRPQVTTRPYVKVPEAQRRPIVQNAPHPAYREAPRQAMPAANGFSRPQPQVRPQQQARPQQQQRTPERREARQQGGHRG